MDLLNKRFGDPRMASGPGWTMAELVAKEEEEDSEFEGNSSDSADYELVLEGPIGGVWRIPKKNEQFYVQYRGFGEEDKTLYFSVVDESAWVCYGLILRWIQVEKTESTLKKCSALEVGKHVAARVPKEGTDLHLIRGTVKAIFPTEARVFDEDEAESHLVPLDAIFEMPQEVLSVPFGALKVKLHNTQLYWDSDLIFHAISKLNLKIGTVFRAKLPFLQEDKPVLRGDGFFSLDVYTKEKYSLADMVVAKIAEMTKIPKPLENAYQEVVVVHAESTGDLYYVVKEPNMYTDLLTQVLLETLNTNIVRELPTAKAIWPEDFTVESIKSSLIIVEKDGKKRKRSDVIFVVPFAEDGMYYRAKLIKPVSEEKVQVLFVDYGNRDVVEYKDIVPLDHFDAAIRAIPPQCLHARIAGVETFSAVVNMILEKCENNFRIIKSQDANSKPGEVDACPVLPDNPSKNVKLRHLLAIAARATEKQQQQ